MAIDKGLDHRGIWRAVYVSLWDDPEFRKFTPIEKLVFLNLRTGPQTNLPVIFQYYLEPIVRQTAASHRSVCRALGTLAARHWIEIDQNAGVLWIRKGLRFDPLVSVTNPKHLTAIKNIILSLPKSQIVKDFIDYYQIPIPYSIAYTIPYANQKEKEEEKEEECEEKEEEYEGKEKHKNSNPFLSDQRSDPHTQVNPLSLSKEDGKNNQYRECGCGLPVERMDKGNTPAKGA